MDLSHFFHSYPGLYATQAFFHSLVASAVVEISIRNWKIRDPAVRQRFFLIAIVFPIFSFPLYQALNPARNSVYFRLGALFDSGRWQSVELPGRIPLGWGLVLVFLVTSFVFVFQELLPIVRHAFESGSSDLDAVKAGGDSAIAKAMEPLPVEKPDAYVFEDDEFVIFSSTGKEGSIYLSSALIEVLDPDELQAALAHEVAHVIRSRRPFLVAVFFLRAILFFNPITLVEFRRSVQEDEKACDDLAVHFTKKPLALADTLRKLYIVGEGEESRSPDGSSGFAVNLERYSHRLNIESRIRRLSKDYPSPSQGGWFAFVLTFIVVAVLDYFIV